MIPRPPLICDCCAACGQAAGFLQCLHEQRAEGPFLVVVPLSTLPNWKRELDRWTSLRSSVLHGCKEARDVLLRHEVRPAAILA